MTLKFFNTKLKRAFLAFLATILSSYALGAEEGGGGFSYLLIPRYAGATGAGGAGAGPGAVRTSSIAHSRNEKHEQKKSTTHICPHAAQGCPFKYTNTDAIFIHIKISHPIEPKPLKCKYGCPASFDDARIRAFHHKIHKITEQGGSTQDYCPYYEHGCPYNPINMYYKKASINKHIRSSHPNIPKFFKCLCPPCPATFGTMTSLSNHRTMHFDNKQIDPSSPPTPVTTPAMADVRTAIPAPMPSYPLASAAPPSPFLLPPPAYAVATDAEVDAAPATRSCNITHSYSSSVATGSSHAQATVVTGNKQGIDSSKKILRCPFFVRGCPFTYTKAERYYHHVHEKHRDKLKPFRCSYPCVANFDTPVELDAHITRRHKVALLASARAVGAGSGVSAVAAAAVSASISPSALVARSFAVLGEDGGVDDSAQVASRKPTHPRDDSGASEQKKRRRTHEPKICPGCPYRVKDVGSFGQHQLTAHPDAANESLYPYLCGEMYIDNGIQKICAARFKTPLGRASHSKTHKIKVHTSNEGPVATEIGGGAGVGGEAKAEGTFL